MSDKTLPLIPPEDLPAAPARAELPFGQVVPPEEREDIRPVLGQFRFPFLNAEHQLADLDHTAIKQIRASLLLTQTEFGQLCGGVSLGTVIRWESGKSTPNDFVTELLQHWRWVVERMSIGDQVKRHLRQHGAIVALYRLLRLTNDPDTIKEISSSTK